MISVIIPVYNSAQYVEKCLLSILNQSFSDYEVILVDDCSTDSSVRIIEDFILKHNLSRHFHVLLHSSNRGCSAARNTGIDASRGEWVYFVDSDDYINPDALRMLSNSVNKYPNTQVVFAGALSNKPYFRCFDYTTKSLPEYSDNKEWLQKSMLSRFAFGMTCWNKLYSYQFLQSNCLRFVEGIIHEDEIWNFDVSQVIERASFIGTNIYNYIINDEGLVGHVSNEEKWRRLFNMWPIMIDRVSNNNKDVQIKALYAYILSEARETLPFSSECFIRLGHLFCSLIRKSDFPNSIVYLLKFTRSFLFLAYSGWRKVKLAH